MGKPFGRPAAVAEGEKARCRFCGCVLCTADSHEGLCLNLVENGLLREDSALAAAFLAVDRAEFVRGAPGVEDSWAYVDAAIYLDHGAQISAPHVHAHALSLLFADEEALSARLASGAAPVHILDIGFGSGVVSALLARLLSLLAPEDGQGSTSQILAVEHMPELVEQARANLRTSHGAALDSGRLTLLCGDGRRLLEQMPELRNSFAFVHCGCAVQPGDEAWLLDLLAAGGRAVFPRGDTDTPQRLCAVDVGEGGDWQLQETEVVVLYVPATSETEQRTRGDAWDTVVDRCRSNAAALLSI